MSHLIEAGEYNRVLLVSSEVGSLESIQAKESFELFSDGQQPLFSKSHQEKGVIASLQRTWSEGVIRRFVEV